VRPEKKTDLAEYRAIIPFRLTSFCYSRIAQPSIVPFFQNDPDWPGYVKAAIIVTHLARQLLGDMLSILAGAFGCGLIRLAHIILGRAERLLPQLVDQEDRCRHNREQRRPVW
jgi:hypothetical protein